MPIKNSKHKILVAVILGIFVVVGLGIWYAKNKNEKIVENTGTSSTASSSPDFARRMAINELPDIGNNSNYKKDETNVYFGTDVVPGADSATFSIINDQFAKDKTHVYSQGRLLEDSNSSTFSIDPIPHDKFSVYLSLSCEDNEWALCYRKVRGADPVTFKTLGYSFSKDNNHVFYNTEIIPDADPKTFAITDGGKYSYTYGHDKNNIFVKGEHGIGIIHGNKYDTLRQIGGDYLAYDDHVYYSEILLKEADIKTFVTVGVTSNYAKDSSSVYFDGQRIPGADPITFSMGDGINTIDKNYTYRLGKIVN